MGQGSDWLRDTLAAQRRRKMDLLRPRPPTPAKELDTLRRALAEQTRHSVFTAEVPRRPTPGDAA